MKLILALIFIMIFSYVLWIKGLLVFQSKLAVAFIGKRGNDYWGAAVTSCTGYTKRVLPLEKGSQYRFFYDENLTDGVISVEICCGKDVVRKFDKINSSTLQYRRRHLYCYNTF